jgi:hypothetical protein
MDFCMNTGHERNNKDIMMIRIKKTLIILASIFVCLCFIQGTTSDKHVSVSGKVINLETGKGVPGVDIKLFKIDECKEFESTTDKEGKFMIKMIPKGKYGIYKEAIYMSCPIELIIYKMPKKIKISPGKNISEINIYLKKGAEISGSVYAADEFTPLKGVAISSIPWMRREGELVVTNEQVFTNEQGKYIIVGVVKGKKFILADALGFANESCWIDVKQGKKYDNVNFILGKGNVSVKRKIFSEKDNQIIKGVLFYFSCSRLTGNSSSGRLKTDKNGKYSLVGLKYPGTFEVDVYHEEYEIIHRKLIELKEGENVLYFRLKPKTKSEKEK